MNVTVGDYVEHREVPAEWEAMLASVSPRTDRAPWLKLAWMAGMPYEVVGRWVVYEMIPLTMVDEFKKPIVDEFRLAALRGPDPRHLGEWVYDEDPPYIKRWVSHSLVSRLQWQLFGETGCAPFLFWIVQGVNGGHRWRLPAIEKHFVTTLYGEGADVPLPGDRPYADFSQRTVDQILRHDKLRKWDEQKRSAFGQFGNKTEAGLHVHRAVYDQEKAYAATMLKYLTDQVEDGVSNLSDKDIERIMARQLPAGTVVQKDPELLGKRLVENTTHALPEA